MSPLPSHIAEIYAKYRILPALQLHQYRVAAVAQALVESIATPLEKSEIVSVCLLHDMGNILKFDMVTLPEFFEPDGIAYWQAIKNEYLQKYGGDVTSATHQIVTEIGVSARTLDLVKSIGFDLTPVVFRSDDLAKKICAYADTRVAPWGVTSLTERCRDLENRYQARYPTPEQKALRQKYWHVSQDIEQQIFAQSSLQASDITEVALSDTIKSLASFEVV